MEWVEIIKTIIDKGFTQAEIADFCKCRQSSIGMLATGARGKRVSYEIGSKLLKMRSEIEAGKLIKG